MSLETQHVLRDCFDHLFRVEEKDLCSFEGWHVVEKAPLSRDLATRNLPRARIMWCPEHGDVKLFTDKIVCPECEIESLAA